jgi:opacity protein-like surface antigen
MRGVRGLRLFLASTAAAFCATMGSPASAADILPTKKDAPDALYNWTGFYGGLNVGAFGAYDPTTSTGPGPYFGPTSVYSGAVSAVGKQSINPIGFLGGSQIGYNWQNGHLVGGLEAGLDYLHLNGSANGAAAYPGFPGTVFLVSAYANADWLLTIRPRVGYAADNWLFYATGGLAAAEPRVDYMFTDSTGGPFRAIQSAVQNSARLGYAIGGGVEWGLTDQLSLKAEYLHVGFDRTTATQTGSNIPRQAFQQSADLRGDFFRVGFNYRFGGPDGWFSAPAWSAAEAAKSDWEFDVGSRTWLSTGKIGAPNPLFNSPPTPQLLSSRIVFSDLNGLAGETFARLDHSSGFFAKGFLGAGAILNGHQNDEDFPAAFVYSNTVSSASGHIGYADVDVGYSLFRAPGAKFGPFVGYNYYSEHINTYGCAQIAGDYTCAVPQAAEGLVQDGVYSSLRLGLSSEFMLTNRLKFTADAAYLPWVNFQGQDDHDFRQLLLPERAPRGDGVMLEASLDYRLTNNWSVGAGARYWTWNTRDGSVTFDFQAFPVTFIEPARYNSERYGVFVQSDYRFGDTTPLTPEGSADAEAPANWTGLYIGGHLGGGFSDTHWSDPFGSTSIGSKVNFAGFGDATHATGPLAGAQIGANWQTGHWVIGAEADGAWADFRGENTCFSGIGGVNCQHAVNSIFDLAARGGFAWDRSLIFAKAGGAWTSAHYNLYGDTYRLALGTGSASAITAGWLLGGGLEYALSDKWSTVVEYDHIGGVNAAPSFPTVAVINTAHIGVSQSVDMFKLGLNYKLF